MMTVNDTHIALRALCDELARCGLRAACTSPGSRCSPLVLALVREPRIRCFSHLDERCGGFFALGLAKAARRPVAVTCTSGTAAAELAPAVIEAHEARVPLIVLTADRPPELRDVGAGQAIDQLGLYGSAAKWFFEVGTHDATPERLRWFRALACRAWWTALDGRPGPVHLNFPLREPLVPEGPLEADAGGRLDGAPWVARSRPAPAAGSWAELALAQRGVVIAGRAERDPALPAAIARFAATAGYPLLADPLSGARRGPAAIAYYDQLLRDPAFVSRSAPELVVRVGDLPTSTPLRGWLAGLDGVEQVALDPESAWQDPAAAVSRIVAADPAATLDALTEQATPAGVQRDSGWLASWRDADSRAQAAIAGTLGAELSEPSVAAELGARLPAAATLFVASSMPVRDVEGYFAIREDPPRVLCNRGANGIDGTVSSAFGAAAAGDVPTVLLIGDVALAHDVGGLLAARRLGLKLTIVLLHNDGGGIFHFLPIAGARDAFEEHVTTPHGLDFTHAAALYGCGHEQVSDLDGFRAALEEALAAEVTTIVEVPTHRAANRELHRRVEEAVAAALVSPPAPAAAPGA